MWGNCFLILTWLGQRTMILLIDLWFPTWSTNNENSILSVDPPPSVVADSLVSFLSISLLALQLWRSNHYSLFLLSMKSPQQLYQTQHTLNFFFSLYFNNNFIQWLNLFFVLIIPFEIYLFFISCDSFFVRDFLEFGIVMSLKRGFSLYWCSSILWIRRQTY